MRNYRLSQIRDWCTQGPADLADFFLTSNFDLWYFFSLLIYMDIQYLNWKIWFISVWRLKAKVMAWLLTWFIFIQSTLISYYTEAFVKTEVACTVPFLIHDWNDFHHSKAAESTLDFFTFQTLFSIAKQNLQFYWYFNTSNSKFQKIWTKTGVAPG